MVCDVGNNRLRICNVYQLRMAVDRAWARLGSDHAFGLCTSYNILLYRATSKPRLDLHTELYVEKASVAKLQERMLKMLIHRVRVVQAENKRKRWNFM